MSLDEFDLFSTDLGRAVFTGRTLAHHNVSVISSKSLFCFWLTGEFCNSYKLHTIRDFNWWWEIDTSLQINWNWTLWVVW